MAGVTAGATAAAAGGAFSPAGNASGGAAFPPTVVVAVTGAGSLERPRECKRRTISTPRRPSVVGSFAAACWRRKSIASRILASRNSMRGIMILSSLLRIRAVLLASRATAVSIGPTPVPYCRTGSSQPCSTCHMARPRVSL